MEGAGAGTDHTGADSAPAGSVPGRGSWEGRLGIDMGPERALWLLQLPEHLGVCLVQVRDGNCCIGSLEWGQCRFQAS